jgi:predicted DNA-binding protein
VKELKAKTISVRVTPEMYDRIVQMARMERRTVSSLALIILELGLEKSAQQ